MLGIHRHASETPLRRAYDGPLKVGLGSSTINFKNKSCQSWIPFDKTRMNYVRRQFNFNRADSHALHVCADPEHFVRGGSERGPKCHKKWTTIGPSAKRHCRNGPPLNAGLVAGSGSILLGNPIFL